VPAQEWQAKPALRQASRLGDKEGAIRERGLVFGQVLE